MATSNGYVHGSCAAEDNQTELYNKRKTWEHQNLGLSQVQLSHQDPKERSHALSETSDDFPQKKLKLGSPQYQSHVVGDYGEEYVL